MEPSISANCILLLIAGAAFPCVMWHRAAQRARMYAGMVRTDPLTGLPNPVAFRESVALLHTHLRRGLLESLAIVFIDLDGFKSLNDLIGHDKADDVVRQFANALRTHVRDADVVARRSGDEFYICCPNTDLLGLEQLMVRLRNHLGGLVDFSAGYALVDGDCLDLETTIRLAEIEMYKHKEAKKLAQ